MKILYLGPDSPLVTFLGNVRKTEERIEDFGDADFVISYGYRHIIRNTAELKRMDGRAINLHISYLPWNRGADPNLWSWVENTPKGVSIHYIDAGIDTGDLIAQQQVPMTGGTLESTYAKLQSTMVELFKDQWPAILARRCGRFPQQMGGTFHSIRDRILVEHLLTNGWQTNVHDLRIP